MLNCRAGRAAINAFSLRYAALLGPENALVSPLGISAALRLLLPAARPDVRAALFYCLGVASLNDGNTPDPPRFLPQELTEARTALASALFADRSVSLNPTLYAAQAEIHTVDFASPAAPAAISAWAAERTGGLISALAADVPPQTYLALVSALYFADAWTEPFLRTRHRIFHGRSGDRTACFLLADEALYMENGTYQAVQIQTSCGGGLCVFLQKDASDRTPAFPASDEEFAALDWRRRPGLLLLPKFRLDAARSCADELKKLGLAPLFEADNPLDRLFEGGVPAKLDAVLQRAVLRVDERGLEAAAATAAFAVGSSPPVPEEPFEMIVDRPFSCLVFDRTEDYMPCILFAGVVSDLDAPLAAQEGEAI